MSVLIAYAFSKTQYDLILPLPGIMRHKNAYLFTLEYRIIGRYGIIARGGGGGGGLETFPKINNRGVWNNGGGESKNDYQLQQILLFEFFDFQT